MIFQSLASSSSGNAYLVSDGQTHILIECGLSHKKLQQACGFKLTSLDAVLISHEHKDHSQCVDKLLSSGIPVYLSGNDEVLGKGAAVTVLASLAMYLYYSPKSPLDFLRTLYTKNVIAPYWYLFSYLGFLILLPFLRKMIRNLTEKEFLYLFGLHLLFGGLIPMLQFFPDLKLNTSLNVALVTTNTVIFPAAGYYLEKKTLSRKHIAALWGLAVLALAATMAEISPAVALNILYMNTFRYMFSTTQAI